MIALDVEAAMRVHFAGLTAASNELYVKHAKHSYFDPTEGPSHES
jgi:hypothetical protein